MIGVMIQGTASDVGKSIVCTALCRSLARKGLKVTPFKSQNMSNNSYVTKDGNEIGRSQGIQAEAACTEASVFMSPILLKPRNDKISEVVHLGKVYETLSGKEYREQFYELGLKTIQQALATLEKEYEVIVIEGAGSPVEMNLNDRELVNMKVAELADVPVILVADIDRGGVFASIAGTLQLLKKEERDRVIGVIINKFRGDPDLFENGRKWIEDHLHVPVLAVLPHVSHRIEAEDSLSRLYRYEKKLEHTRLLDIAVIDLPYFANDTDIEPFRYEEDVSIRFVRLTDELGHPDAVIVPSTQSPIEDLQKLNKSSVAKQLQRYAENGGTIFAIGSGYEMLGSKVKERTNTEKGLQLFPIETTIRNEKEVKAISATLFHMKEEIDGFYVHSSEITYEKNVRPFIKSGEVTDGVYIDDGRLIGTKIHHCFYHDKWRTNWLNRLRRKKKLIEREVVHFHEKRRHSYDELADWLEQELDVDRLIKKMKEWKKHRG